MKELNQTIGFYMKCNNWFLYEMQHWAEFTETSVKLFVKYYLPLQALVSRAVLII